MTRFRSQLLNLWQLFHLQRRIVSDTGNRFHSRKIEESHASSKNMYINPKHLARALPSSRQAPSSILGMSG